MERLAQPIRVARVIARMNVGGPAWQVSVLTRGLQEPEFETILLCGTVSDGEADFVALRTPDLTFRLVPGMGRSVRVLGDVRSLIWLVREFRRFRPDIVHTHTAKAGAVGRLAAVLARVPIKVHTYHGHLLRGYFGRGVTRIVIVIEQLLGRMTSGFVAVGSQVRDDLLEVGIGRPDRFSVISPGVSQPASMGSAEARREIGLRSDEKVVLFVGRFTGIKRVDRLIEAFRLVIEATPSAVLLLVGDGELELGLREQASDLGALVRFEGWQSNLAPYYAAADVAVLSSDNEGMPVTLIEASMAGIPCVTTRVGSAAEVVEDGSTGFVVEPTAQSIADALIRLLNDDELRHAMGARAASRAHDLFGQERLLEDHRRLYRRLMGRPEVASAS